MLTEAEKKWLYSRENVEMVTGTYLCQSCQYMDDELEECIFRRCPKFVPNFRDAAEFEARVAATIARGEFYRPCHSVDIEKCAYPVEGSCCVCHIKYARLAVEQEMEKEGK